MSSGPSSRSADRKRSMDVLDPMPNRTYSSSPGSPGAWMRIPRFASPSTRFWRDTTVTRPVMNGPQEGSGCRNDNRRKNRYSRDRSSRTSFSVAATEGRFSNVAIAPAIASGCTPEIARSSPSANPGGATAQAQEISGIPAHGAKDRITMTLSSSRASGRRENSEYSANRSSMTTYVHARDNRTVSAGETIDPSGFDGESMMARPFAGISAAISAHDRYDVGSATVFSDQVPRGRGWKCDDRSQMAACQDADRGIDAPEEMYRSHRHAVDLA